MHIRLWQANLTTPAKVVRYLTLLSNIARFQFNNSHLKIIILTLYSNLHILPAETTRGHHCSPLLHVGNLISELRGNVETQMMYTK